MTEPSPPASPDPNEYGVGSSAELPGLHRSLEEMESMFAEEHHHYDPLQRLDKSSWGCARHFCFVVLNTSVNEVPLFDSMMALVIFTNVILMAIETDVFAQCVIEGTDDCKSPTWLSIFNVVLLIIYVVEVAVRCFTLRLYFFWSIWNLIDMAVVCIGILGFALTDIVELPSRQINLLRIFRISRVMRVLKVLRRFPTLWNLLSGLLGAIETILWGLFIIMVSLFILAIVAVETIHPTAWDVFHQPGNEWCRSAFSTVVRATFYSFTTLVAADAWGTCAIPVIDRQPELWIIFAITLVTVQLGFTNLMLAIIVDKAAEAREGSKDEQACALKKAQKESFKLWAKVMTDMDTDGNGTISNEELMVGYEDPNVRRMLDEVGITKNDLDLLFKLMDADDSGSLSYVEFIESLLKAQVQNPKVYLMTLQLRVQKIELIVAEKLEAHLRKMERRFDSLHDLISKPYEPNSDGDSEAILGDASPSSMSLRRKSGDLGRGGASSKAFASQIRALRLGMEERIDAVTTGAAACAARAEQAAAQATAVQSALLAALQTGG